MARTDDWKTLRDGVALHANHLFQIGEHGETVAAGVALAAGLGGRFVAALGDGQRVNSIQIDDQARTLDVENVHVVTAGGYLASLPGAKKSFVAPAASESRFLNLHHRDFKTTAVWENKDAEGPRSVGLAEWTGQGFRLKPPPADVSALAPVADAFAALQEGAQELKQTLLELDDKGLTELRLQASEAHHLSSLYVALERVLYLARDASLGVALPLLMHLAEQCRGWASFVAAKSGAGQGSFATPDVMGRARLSQTANLPLPDYLQDLDKPPVDGSDHIRFFEALARTIVGLNRVIRGERDEDALEPFETFDPDLFPGDGLGLRYAPPSSAELTFRCDLSAPRPPELYWGMAHAGVVPNLRVVPLDSTAGGRYEALLGPVSPEPGEQLVLVVDDARVSLRVYLPR